jgi:hypothetical protein
MELLRAARSLASTTETRLRVQEIGADLAGASIDDRLLDALTADEPD